MSIANKQISCDRWYASIGRKLCGFLLALLLSALPISLYAQTSRQISGMVKDASGEPLIGVSVVVAGSSSGTITNAIGQYRINISEGKSRLTFSYVGFEPQTVDVGARTTVDITLKEDAKMLSEVQIIAYGVQKKVTVTGAISGVKGETLSKIPTGSISNMLAGPLAGVSTVQYSGEPGADGAEIFIRGKATFGDASPLIQVDGVERSLNDIDPNDIENITVLKDASATAVFGVRGANGVILVTTKRGLEGKPKVSITSTESILIPTKLPEMANSYQYALYHNQMRMNDGLEPLFSDEVIEKFRTHSDPLRFPDIDWMDYIMEDMTFQTRNNISISGGTQSVRYYLSAGAYTEGGLIKQFDQEYDNSYKYKRFNYRGNVDIDVTKSTTLSLSIGGSMDSSNKAKTSTVSNLIRKAFSTAPFSSAGIIDGKFVRSQTTYKTWEGTEAGVPFAGSNPIPDYYGQGYLATTNNRLTADIVLNQKLDFLTKGLSFKLKGSYNSSFYEQKTAEAGIATYSAVLQEDGSFLYQKNGENKPLSIGSSTSLNAGRNWYMDASLNYTRDFGSHHVGTLLLYNQSKTYYPSTFSDVPSGYVGLVGRITYDYKDRYMLDFNVGYNGSENFAPDKRFGWFPAGSVGYILSEENYFKPIKKVISFLKLRASWGLVGNDKIGSSRFYYLSDPFGVNSSGLFIRGTNYGYNFGTGAGTTLMGAWEKSKNNQDVTWEKAFKQNYGMDINFFDDRLKASYDYYIERRRDIFVSDATAPSIIGFTPPMANLGAVDSWGSEISLKWNDRLNDNFRYWVGMNLSYNQNKVVEKKEVQEAHDYMMQKNHRIGSRLLLDFWKFYYEGIESDYEKTFGSPFPTHQEVLQPGDCVYVDLNKDGVIDASDYSRNLGIYTDDPEYTIGIDLGFSWKRWDFSMQLTGAWNVSREMTDIFRRPFFTQNTVDEGGLLLAQYKNTWTPENPSQSADYPRARVGGTNVNSTLYVKDASYLRLKSAQLSYSFDFPFMKKMKLNQFVVSLSGYNMFTFTGFEYGDPESRTSNSPQYPLTRTFALGLKLGF